MSNLWDMSKPVYSARSVRDALPHVKPEGRDRKFMSIVIERECRGVDIHCTENKAVTAIVKERQVTL